jgi:hypothetical protein
MYIRMRLGSNLCRDIGDLDRGFCGFPQSLEANSGIVPRLGHDLFSSRSFLVLQSSTILLFGAAKSSNWQRRKIPSSPNILWAIAVLLAFLMWREFSHSQLSVYASVNVKLWKSRWSCVAVNAFCTNISSGSLRASSKHKVNLRRRNLHFSSEYSYVITLRTRPPPPPTRMKPNSWVSNQAQTSWRENLFPQSIFFKNMKR